MLLYMIYDTKWDALKKRKRVENQERNVPATAIEKRKIEKKGVLICYMLC